ncbi:hypothetical protein ACIHFE_15875 [Streptomyces sp. NPDC052396]|uniref:hypothetical protein n=1 Tax=Streptomyces sp. NPDC052396 TaxID=3365689 RepID=UPI0037D0F99E
MFVEGEERTVVVAGGDGGPVPGAGGFPYAASWADGTGEAAAPPPVAVPRLAAGLRLHGEYQGSGFTTPKYLARRADGQVVQLSRLLHLVVTAVDGRRDMREIARVVSAGYGREVSPENIAYLVEHKLDPLGVTVPEGAEDDQPNAPRSDLLLSLKGHRVLFGERRVQGIARSLAWLHRPPVVVLVLLAALAMDTWLFAFHGAMTPVLQVLEQPLLLLAVFALTVASLLFHEFGHASACRYSGARPGCIGCGLFLIWPSMYTDVTDVYRIGRAGRIRTDLGGVYFNVVFMLGLTGVYFLTGQPFLLSAVYLGHFEVLEQLMPAVRLDGYFILGDLAGVPDLYGRIRPILLSALPGRPVHPAVAELKRSTRVIVTTWVLTMVPLLAGDLCYALWNLPRLIDTGLRSLVRQLAGTWAAFADGQLAAGLAGVLGSLMLVCPLAGMAYLSVRLTGRLLRNALRATAGRPRLRAVLAVGAAGLAAGLGLAWSSGVTPRPLPPAPPIAPILQPHVPTAEPPAAGGAVGHVEPAGKATGHGRTGGASALPWRPATLPVPVPLLPPAPAASAAPPARPAPRPSAAPVPARSPAASPAPRPVPKPGTTPTGRPPVSVPPPRPSAPVSAPAKATATGVAPSGSAAAQVPPPSPTTRRNP